MWVGLRSSSRRALPPQTHKTKQTKPQKFKTSKTQKVNKETHKLKKKTTDIKQRNTKTKHIKPKFKTHKQDNGLNGRHKPMQLQYYRLNQSIEIFIFKQQPNNISAREILRRKVLQ